MKRIYLYLGILCFIAAGSVLTGCYKDVISPESDPDGPPQFVSFKTDLEPVFNSNCALSGCHATGAPHLPDLTAGKSYNSIVNGGFVNTLIPKESILYKMVNGEMSTYMPSPKDKGKVYDWIRNGAPNN